ncbi:MAG: ABC transporter permease [Planctomycetes bacterium]|nr:ABC transporter permease [Planctomycetota bacterium]
MRRPTMTFFGLLCRNLLYHRRGNLAVFLGVILGTAVLTGALLVGDSLRGSLKNHALEQLGWVDQAMVPPRFFRAALAEEIAPTSSPVLLLQGSAKFGERRAGKVTLLGVDKRFWRSGVMPLDSEFWQSNEPEAVLNATLARQLHLKAGDEFDLSVQKSDSMPRESLLGKRGFDDVLQTVAVRVRLILPDDGPSDESLAGFSLKPSPEPVRNVFVPLRFLQEKLDLPGQANAVLVGELPATSTLALNDRLRLEDWGLKLRTPEDRARALANYLQPHSKRQKQVTEIQRIHWDRNPNAKTPFRVPEELAQAPVAKDVLHLDDVVAYYRKHRDYLSLESAQLYLDPAVVDAVNAIREQRPDLKISPSLVYLADSISDGNNEAPYAVLAGVEPSSLRFVGDSAQGPLGDGEIALVDWEDSPLHPKKHDLIRVEYYAPDTHNTLKLEKHRKMFSFRGLVPLEGPFDDPDLTPEFPGITDKLDMGSWENPPFPYHPKRIKAADENYWKRYRTTPKAYVTLETAQKLWGSRFGKLTSFRIYPGDEKTDKVFAQSLLQELKPEQGGFVFQPVKEMALKSGAGSTDFSLLFVAFSFFLIVAALLLIGLLFRLNLERRSSEIGVLMATGWDLRRVRRLLLGEGLILAILGGLVGLAGAIIYAERMLALLRRNWPGGENLAFLRVHVQPLSFAIGYAASLAVSLLTIMWATRILSKMSPRALLAGESSDILQPESTRRRWSTWILACSTFGAFGCLAAGLVSKDSEAQAGSFFGSGALFLTTSLAGLWGWLKRTGRQTMPQPSLGALGMRNAGRHPVRSLLTVGLLAAATFLIVAVDSFHKEAGGDFFKKDGGSGGFPLLAETDIPFYQDLNNPAVRAQLKFPDQPRDSEFYPARVQAGDDASCLNLYQPLRPKILGIGHRLIERGGFHFSASLATDQDEKENPWRLLEKPTGDDTIPAIIDANSAQWILKVPLGGIYSVTDENGEKKNLRIVALLAESIFQSEILISEANFLKLYPRQEGYRVFLIDCPSDRTSAIQSDLGKILGDQGFNVVSTADRLRAYLAVENTYLATFQALGGLGLLLGALGLAIVLLRGVWERRGELALLRALGFAKERLAWLVLAENLFLLMLGLGAGTLAALLAVAPHLLSSGGDVLWLRLIVLLGLVAVVGLAAGMAAIVGALRTPLLPALRRE